MSFDYKEKIGKCCVEKQSLFIAGIMCIYFFPVVLRPVFGSWPLLLRGFAITLILDTPQSVGLLWTCYPPDAENST
jgi:hypothetical protein